LEDAEDYKAFEAAITADYDAQSAVERELVLQLASLLWRLRRATMMETGLFEIEAEHVRNHRPTCQTPSKSRDLMLVGSEIKFGDAAMELAHCFLELANLSSFALDRLSRYEATLWRQVSRILFALDALDRCKPQERRRSAVTAAHLLGLDLAD